MSEYPAHRLQAEDGTPLEAKEGVIYEPENRHEAEGAERVRETLHGGAANPSPRSGAQFHRTFEFRTAASGIRLPFGRLSGIAALTLPVAVVAGIALLGGIVALFLTAAFALLIIRSVLQLFGFAPRRGGIILRWPPR